MCTNGMGKEGKEGGVQVEKIKKVSPQQKQQKKIMQKKVWKQVRSHWQLYMLMLLPIIYIFVFKYAPMYGILIGFKQYNASKGVWGSPWVGLKWFRMFWESPQFGRLIGNTITISLYNLLGGLIPPIILAIAINEMRIRPVKKVAQLITYMPHFLSVVVITSMLQQILSHNGMVNNLLASLGLERISFLGKPELFPHIFVWSGVWQNAGYNAIIYIAALAGISPELGEAAQIDGANIWQRIWHIDIPGILPTAVILLIMGSANVLNVGFEKIFLLQNDLNKRASDVISTYVYNIGLKNMEYSLATAIGLFQSVVSLVVLFIVNKISKKVTENSLW